MKLDNSQLLDISALRGALLTNPDGADFYVIGIGLDASNHLIIIELKECGTNSVVGVAFDSIKDWTVQFRPHYQAPEY